MSWEREMDEAIAAQGPADQGPPVDIAPEVTIADRMGLIAGSITFAPDAAHPCHCRNCVVLQAEVERLRRGNAELLKANRYLQQCNADLRAMTK